MERKLIGFLAFALLTVIVLRVPIAIAIFALAVFIVLRMLHRCRKCGAWFKMEYMSSHPDSTKQYRCKQCGDIQIRNIV